MKVVVTTQQMEDADPPSLQLHPLLLPLPLILNWNTSHLYQQDAVRSHFLSSKPKSFLLEDQISKHPDADCLKMLKSSLHFRTLKQSKVDISFSTNICINTAITDFIAKCIYIFVSKQI